LNDRQIHVSSIDSLSEALIFSIPGNREGDDMNKGMQLFTALLNIRTSIKHWGSVAMEIAYVAAGNAEGAVYNAHQRLFRIIHYTKSCFQIFNE